MYRYHHAFFQACIDVNICAIISKGITLCIAAVTGGKGGGGEWA